MFTDIARQIGENLTANFLDVYKLFCSICVGQLIKKNNAYLHIHQNDSSKFKLKLKTNFKFEKDAFIIPLGKSDINVVLH